MALTFFDLMPEAIGNARKKAVEEITEKVRKTKPPAPAPKANDSYEIERVRLEEGQVKTFITGQREPTRFYTDHTDLNIITVYKNIFSVIVKNNRLGLLMIVLNKKAWSLWFQKIFNVYPIVNKDEFWSEPVREIHRITKGKFDQNILNAVLVILENDMAYRYRFQDIVAELNKENFNKKPIKELRRLLDIALTREHSNPAKIFRIARKYVWLLRFKGLKQLKEIVKDIDIDKIKLSKEDVYWTAIVPNYDYRGLSYEARVKEHNTVE